MKLELKKIELPEIRFFQQKMVESFQYGVLERFGDLSAAPVPQEDDLSQSVKKVNTDIWAIMLDGVPAGAAVIVKDVETGRYSLDLLFIFKEFINKRIGAKHGGLLKKLTRKQRYGKLIPHILSGATSIFTSTNAVSK